jgi:hypothetical protein
MDRHLRAVAQAPDAYVADPRKLGLEWVARRLGAGR